MEKAAIRQQILHDLNRRYATKKYDPNKHLAPADWETILTAGRLSPSSYGYEPWKFVLLDQQARQDIQPFAWGAVASAKGADKLIAILVRKDVTYNSPYVQHLVRDIKHKEFSETDPRTLNFKNFQENEAKLTTNREYWVKKIKRNIERDQEVNARLRGEGYTVLRFWGEEIEKHLDDCVDKIVAAVEQNKTRLLEEKAGEQD